MRRSASVVRVRHRQAPERHLRRRGAGGQQVHEGSPDAGSGQGCRLERPRQWSGSHALPGREGRRPHRSGPAAPETQVGLRLRQRRGAARTQPPSPVAACSSPARTAKCMRWIRPRAARTGPSRHRPACAPRPRSRRIKAQMAQRLRGARRRHARQPVWHRCRARGTQLWTARVDDARRRPPSPARPSCTTAACSSACRASARKVAAAAAATPAAPSAAASSAFDVTTGKRLWKTCTVDEPKPRAKNAAGVQMFGPAGGSIWSAPSIDVKRGLVYAATGNGFADPPQTDDRFGDRLRPEDRRRALAPAAHRGRPVGHGLPGHQPEQSRPARRRSARTTTSRPHPSSRTVGQRDLIVLPQKSGVAYALDPDKKGAAGMEDAPSASPAAWVASGAARRMA